MPIAKLDPQGVGSATTYGLRYSLMASLGLPPLDDDAEATRQQVPEKPRQEAAKAPTKAPLPVANKSRAIYVENSLERIATFEKSSDLITWAKTERQKVWPQYNIDPMDPDGQRIVKVYKARMSELGAAVESAEKNLQPLRHVFGFSAHQGT